MILDRRSLLGFISGILGTSLLTRSLPQVSEAEAFGPKIACYTQTGKNKYNLPMDDNIERAYVTSMIDDALYSFLNEMTVIQKMHPNACIKIDLKELQALEGRTINI